MPIFSVVAGTQDILHTDAAATTSETAAATTAHNFHNATSVATSLRSQADGVSSTRPPIEHNAIASAVDAPLRRSSRLTKELSAQVTNDFFVFLMQKPN